MPVIKHVIGDRNRVEPCGKLATVKSKLRDGYVCSKHALEEQQPKAARLRKDIVAGLAEVRTVLGNIQETLNGQ